MGSPTDFATLNHLNGNLQLIACAGSGKPKVVARRVANLLKPGPNATLPRNIIAFTFTFTEKAAAELKERIAVNVVDVYGNESTVVRELS